MTTKELNRDIKRLYANIEKAIETQGDASTYLLSTAAPEFKRLYNADSEFKYMNKQSVLIMLRLNLRYRFIPLHSFGLHIEL